MFLSTERDNYSPARLLDRTRPFFPFSPNRNQTKHEKSAQRPIDYSFDH
jgi:hypothetical protein